MYVFPATSIDGMLGSTRTTIWPLVNILATRMIQNLYLYTRPVITPNTLSFRRVLVY
jgi:hypothetical protein